MTKWIDKTVLKWNMMRQSQGKSVIDLTPKGVFQTTTTSTGEAVQKKIARQLRLRAIGRREPDGATFGQVRFRTIHGNCCNQLFPMSKFLPENRREIRAALADLGYRWPEDKGLANAILDQVANTDPKQTLRIVSAPGWYGSTYVIPGRAFAARTGNPEIVIDPNSTADLGAFVLGSGSLRGWQQFVAAPSRKSRCLRLSIAAALAAPFLRPLGLDSFGINWFGKTSDGKSLSAIIAASVPGFMGPGGLAAWADSEPAIEALAYGHRDSVMPLDESADGEHQMPLERKAQMLAFLIARNRPRRLSPVYERNNNLANREYRIILVSTSERALGQIARDAGDRRLGGEEVRFIVIPASELGSSGIFDGNIDPTSGMTLRQTTKNLAETLKAAAIVHQGYAIRALLEKYVNDPHGLASIRKYKAQFEADAKIPEQHNAYFRVRSNFAVTYAAAALAIDYHILPWKKKPTFRAIEKCMSLALATMETGANERASTPTAIDAHQIAKTLQERLAEAKLVVVRPKRKVTAVQACIRQKAEGFQINGELYVKPDRFRRWIPDHLERAALKTHKIIVTEREDAATVERKIGGIKGKPRYYRIDVNALGRLVA